MTQTALAYEDVFDGNWTPTPVSEWIRVDPILDLFYVSSGVNPMSDAFEVKLDRLFWPQAGPQSLTVRLRETSSENMVVNIALLQGNSVIASRDVSPTQSFTSLTFVLTPAEVRQITNYADLRVLVTAGAIPNA